MRAKLRRGLKKVPLATERLTLQGSDGVPKVTNIDDLKCHEIRMFEYPICHLMLLDDGSCIN